MRESDLSDADRRALAFVRAYSSEHGRAPSYVEVGAHLGLPFPNNAKRNCDRLVARGLLSREHVGGGAAGRPRALKLVAEQPRDLVLPYRGRVSCGPGREPEDRDGEEIDLRAFLRTGDAAVFRACGDSMLEAHITDGDLLLVSENPDPPAGAVVVALVGEQMVCKRLAKKGARGVLLEARNGDLPPIVVDVAQVPFRILGVLQHIIRKV